MTTDPQKPHRYVPHAVHLADDVGLLNDTCIDCQVITDRLGSASESQEPRDRYELVNALTALAIRMGWTGHRSAITTSDVVTVTYQLPVRTKRPAAPVTQEPPASCACESCSFAALGPQRTFRSEA